MNHYRDQNQNNKYHPHPPQKVPVIISEYDPAFNIIPYISFMYFFYRIACMPPTDDLILLPDQYPLLNNHAKPLPGTFGIPATRYNGDEQTHLLRC